MSDPGAEALDEPRIAQKIRPLFSRALAPGRPIYLANHSLGRAPDRMAQDVERALDAWYRDMGEAWDEWLAAREKFRALTARLVGALTADSIVPKTSAGQGLRAVLNAHEGRIRVVTTDAEFDSLDFILRVYRDRGRIELATVPARAEALIGALRPKTDLAALGTDFAIGGSYKYTRGGPGACWLYVRPVHQALRTLDTGWFAKENPFGYERPEPPRFGPGGDAWLESTPPALAPVQALAGLEFTLSAGVERLRAFHLVQKLRFAALLADRGIRVDGAGADFGAFLTCAHPQASRLAGELARRGVKTDARGDRLRLCADLLNTDGELATASELLGTLLGKL